MMGYEKMALISLRQLLDHAAEYQYGLPAFNVNNMEQIHAILQAANEVDSPVILQASAGARGYAGEPFMRKLVEAAIEQYPRPPSVYAPGSWCIAARVSGSDSQRIFQRNDGWLAGKRRQNTLLL